MDKLFGSFSARGSALSKYKLGMAKAKSGKYREAIDDYTVVIDSLKTPADVKAMALFNRSLAYTSAGDEPSATQDLETLLNMEGVPPHVQQEAADRRHRIKKKSQIKIPTI